MSDKIESLLDDFNQWYEKLQKKLNIEGDLKVPIEELHGTSHRKISIPRDDYIAALISQEVYKPPEEREKKIEVFILDQRFNTERTAIYKTDLNFDDKVIIGIRGTSNSLVDILSDVLILTGKDRLSIRKSLQVNFIKEALEKLQKESYNLNQSIIAGHSLGGLITAYLIESIPKIKGIGFNMGSSPFQSDILSKFTFSSPVLRKKEDYIRFKNYFMKGDIISISSKHLYYNTIELEPTPPAENPIQAHKISFLINHTKPNPPLRK